MNEQQKIFWEVIEIFSKENILDNFIVIGSWAEYLYELSYFKDFRSSLKTMDADFLIKNLKPRVPGGKINLPQILENNNFLFVQDSLNGISKFYKSGSFEIEFLVREMGAGSSEPYTVETLNLKAEGLRYMEMLHGNSMTLNINGHQINVPTPQSYILHKLVINDRRGTKKEKDLRAIERILEAIFKNEQEILKLKLTYNELPSKSKRKIDKVCKDNLISLFSGHLSP